MLAWNRPPGRAMETMPMPIFNWLWGRRKRSAGKSPAVRTLEEDLEELRQNLRQTGMPEEGIERVCDQLREEVEARARQQREQSGNSPSTSDPPPAS